MRRTLEIIAAERIPTQEQRMPGVRMPVRVIQLAGIVEYRKRRDAPRGSTITVPAADRTPADGAGKAVAKRASAEPWISLIPALAAHLAKLSEFQERLRKPFEWLTVREAAEHVGLTRSLIERACVEGRLPSVMDGPPSKQRRMVRVEDLEKLRFG